MVTSDLRAEVEIWLFRACAMHPAIIRLQEQFVHCGRGYGAVFELRMGPERTVTGSGHFWTTGTTFRSFEDDPTHGQS